jgi:hypothetical protein
MNGGGRLLVLLALVTTPSVGAAESGFKKAYFGATRPGTYATMMSTDEKGGISQYTYSRLADQGPDRWLELKYLVVSGQFKGTESITGCLVPASFPLEMDAIDFQAHSRRCAAGASSSPVAEYPPDTMKAIASGIINYANMVTFKGTETVAGKSCDRYAYSYKTNYMNTPATMSGDLWMSDSVPFGIVKEVSATRDGSGKVLAKFETVLASSGGGAQSGLRGWSWGGATGSPRADSPRDDGSSTASMERASTPPPPAEIPAQGLGEAFARGALRIVGEIYMGSKDPGRVRITITNQSAEPVRIALTRAPMMLTVGTPLETLTLATDADRTLEIVPGKSAVPVEMSQRGPRRATSGVFTISMQGGQPLFKGSVDVESVKAE